VPSVIRRLSRREYDGTVRDLLGDTSAPASAFPTEEKAFGFDNNAQANGTSELLTEQQQAAAERLAARFVRGPRLAMAAGCDPLKDEACLRTFIARFGRRVWRRPLTDAEQARLLRVFVAGKDRYDAETGLEMLLSAALQSPHFLYRVELGEAPQPGRSVVRLTGWELASRLSYFLWGTMPDDALFTAAERGELSRPEGIARQVDRMLAAGDPRARAMVANFHEQWLELAHVAELDKSRSTYGAVGYTPELRPLWQRETETFVDEVFWNDGKLATLFTAPYSYADRTLARFYDPAARVEGDAFVRVALDPKERAGLLTQAGLLALHAKRDQTSPVHRGMFVRRDLFCFEPPAPPAVEGIDPPALDPKLTTRERWSRHSEDPSCAGCHRLIDPLGLGFENYDAVGTYRTTENGRPIDPSGEIVGTDVPGPFTGAVALGQRLARSAEVRACVTLHWYRYAFGTNGDTPADACAVAALAQQFAAAGNDMRELLRAITRSDAFLYRSAHEGGAL
jgi:hypothetical protein